MTSDKFVVFAAGQWITLQKLASVTGRVQGHIVLAVRESAAKGAVGYDQVVSYGAGKYICKDRIKQLRAAT